MTRLASALPGTAATLLLLSALTACSPSGAAPTADPSTGSGGTPPAAQEPALSVGDCTQNHGAVEPADLVIVPCEEPHDEEVFYVSVAPGDEYDVQAMDEMASRECTGEPFTAYVGIARDSSALAVVPVYPTEERWAQGDHTVYCLLSDETGPVTGSLRGSAR